MRIFGVPEAKHYCRKFQGSAGHPAGSLGKYILASLKAGDSLREGTVEFDLFRDCSLRDVERCVFLAISNFRRSLDLMMPVASSWAHVTLYYSSYFSARALLGMFGGWFGHRTMIEVAASQPGNQELIVTKVTKVHTTYTGSHDSFWDIFYRAVSGLSPWVQPRFRFALTPVSNNVAWQSQNRNEVNYDSFSALELAANFQSSFNIRKFPASLPGTMSTQFYVAEGLLSITAKFLREFGLTTDGLDVLRPVMPRRGKIERLIFRDRAPSTLRVRKWRSIRI